MGVGVHVTGAPLLSITIAIIAKTERLSRYAEKKTIRKYSPDELYLGSGKKTEVKLLVLTMMLALL